MTMNLSEPVMAAVIGASATIATALFQLMINARRQAAERAAGKPASRKSGNWLAIFALMLASVVAGYALAEYQDFRTREDDRMLRQEMQTRLRDIGEVAVRLERAGQKSDQAGAEAWLAAERRRGAEGVVALIGLSPCAATQSSTQSALPCSEASALHASVCAIIPAAASVTEVQLFTQLEDAAQPWTQARVQPGQDAGAAKFIDGHYERAQPDAKEVCQRFAHWNSQKARLARIVVKYTM